MSTPLRQRSFRLFFIPRAASLMGGSMAPVTQGRRIFRRTTWRWVIVCTSSVSNCISAGVWGGDRPQHRRRHIRRGHLGNGAQRASRRSARHEHRHVPVDGSGASRLRADRVRTDVPAPYRHRISRSHSPAHSQRGNRRIGIRSPRRRLGDGSPAWSTGKGAFPCGLPRRSRLVRGLTARPDSGGTGGRLTGRGRRVDHRRVREPAHVPAPLGVHVDQVIQDVISVVATPSRHRGGARNAVCLAVRKP